MFTAIFRFNNEYVKVIQIILSSQLYIFKYIYHKPTYTNNKLSHLLSCTTPGLIKFSAIINNFNLEFSYQQILTNLYS